MKFWKTNTVTYTNHNTNITAHSLKHLLLYSTITYVTKNTDTYITYDIIIICYSYNLYCSHYLQHNTIIALLTTLAQQIDYYPLYIYLQYIKKLRLTPVSKLSC